MSRKLKKLNPKISISLKKWLVALNMSLDIVKQEITSSNERYYFDFDEFMSSNIKSSIIYMEDRGFFKHYGFDLRSIPRAIKRCAKNGKIDGISTIDQQVVRISTGRFERTIGRKVNEIILAILINSHCSKSEIIQYYIHNAYLGYGITGCDNAARILFNKTLTSLDEYQAAFIAALHPLPMPKSVIDAYKSSSSYQHNNPNYIIELADTISPRWAGRIKEKFRVALIPHGLIPNAL